MIRILFLDTSALLSFFVSDKGTQTMRWLLSSDNKAHNAIRYVINNQVISEFEDSLKALVSKDDMKQATADNILALFNTHYKKYKFKVVGKDASVKDTMDGMYNFLGRLSRPVLVTCNTEQAENNNEYKTINPQIQTPAEIELELKGKTRSLEKIRKENISREKTVKDKSREMNLYREFFGKTKMTLTLWRNKIIRERSNHVQPQI